MKQVQIIITLMSSLLIMSNSVYGYTFGFTNLMAGPVNVRIKLSGINEPWYTAHLRGAKESGTKDKVYEFEFQVDAKVSSDMKRKFGFCLSQIQVQPYEYDEIKGAWENTGLWYDADPRFVESTSFNKMVSAAAKFADGFKDAAGSIIKSMSKGVPGVKKVVSEESESSAGNVSSTELLVIDVPTQQKIANKDLYTTLGVTRNASQDEIRTAYKKMALKWHPDRNKGNEVEAAEKFKEMAAANDILSDATKRAQYDRGSFSVANNKPQALIKNAIGDWHMVPTDKVTAADKARSRIQSFQKGAKIASKVIESIPLENIVESMGGIIAYSLCKDRHFHILPNIDTEGDEVPGPVVTTNAR